MFKFLLHARDTNIGLLILRVLTGAFMAFGHGLPKLQAFSDKFHTFPDPLHIGNEASYLLATGAEFVCALMVVFGLLTRFAVIPLVINMLVIVFIVHGDDPWGKKEFAMIYLVPFLALLFSGPGKYSLDHLIFGKKQG